MALLHESVETKKFDVRVVQRHLERGVIRPEDVEKVTKQLPDDAENAEWVSIETLAQQDEGKKSLN